MANRYVLPPETEKEKIFMGLTMGQLMWLAGGLLVGFGIFVLSVNTIKNVWFSLVVGIFAGGVVLPFMFLRPKKGTMSLVSYFKSVYKIKRRNNELPNRKRLDTIPHDEESAILSTEGDNEERPRSVHDINISLGGEG